VCTCISHNNITCELSNDSRRVYCDSKRNGRCSFDGCSSPTRSIRENLIYCDKRPREDSTSSCFSRLVSRLSGAHTTFLSNKSLYRIQVTLSPPRAQHQPVSSYDSLRCDVCVSYSKWKLAVSLREIVYMYIVYL